MSKTGIIIIIILLFQSLSFSQIGGTYTFGFLNLTNSARVTALGGNVISVNDGDLNLVYHNPSLLDSSMDNNIVLNYADYFAGINYGYVGYAKNFGKLGNFAAGLHYINYGEFIEADEKGTILGTFRSEEYSQNLYWSKPLDSLFTFGANLKLIYSELERYTSSGIALDADITFDKNKWFTAALVVKNFGTQLKTYSKKNYEPLPFDIQLAVSKKLRYAPMRLILHAQHLQKLNLLYTNPNDSSATKDPVTGESLPEKKFPKLLDNIGRHIIVGVELTPIKNLYLRFGYNYQRRRELTVDTRPFLVGMSAGIGFRIYKFHFSYARAQYHLAGATNHFSVSVNLSDFLYKKI
ncbi:MAG: type IX secretion system protein PorQ [Bacteroidia bacterium]|nr:type IX secretion system protein PorQ [Bacteroidia bacterium]